MLFVTQHKRKALFTMQHKTKIKLLNFQVVVQPKASEILYNNSNYTSKVNLENF